VQLDVATRLKNDSHSKLNIDEEVDVTNPVQHRLSRILEVQQAYVFRSMAFASHSASQISKMKLSNLQLPSK
jgi:preprotein translocase subunit SecB